jgi:uncharacterized RDD family membrane protein YckC
MIEAPEVAEPAPGSEQNPEEMHYGYASWGLRFGAGFFDSLLTLLPLLIVAGIASYAVGDPNAPGDATDELAGGLVVLLGLPLIVLYHVLFRTHTPGKRIVGIAVRDDPTGASIGYGRAFGRALVTLVLWIPFYLPGILDGLWSIWDRKHQSIHDKAIGTSIVRLRPR